MIRTLKYIVTFVLALVILSSCGRSNRTAAEFVPPVFPPPPDKARFIYDRTIRNTFDVKKLTTFDRIKQIATGTSGAGIGLSKPYGVAVYHGRVYISDTVARQVLLFDYPNRDYKQIGSDDSMGTLVKPIGLCIDKVNKRLYVADNTARRVVAYDLDGKFLAAYGGTQLLHRPTGVAVSPDGSRLYVIDTGGVDTSAHHMFIFDTESGSMLKRVGTRGKNEGEFNLPLQRLPLTAILSVPSAQSACVLDSFPAPRALLSDPRETFTWSTLASPISRFLIRKANC